MSSLKCFRDVPDEASQPYWDEDPNRKLTLSNKSTMVEQTSSQPERSGTEMRPRSRPMVAEWLSFAAV